MIIKRFRARSFRNIESCDIEFHPGVNLLHGRNAQGKTNAMEGIYFFSRGRSFRGRDDSELMRMGSDGFRIAIEYEDSCGEQSLEYAHYGKERLRKKNGYKIVGTSSHSKLSVYEYPMREKIVFVVGQEADGISKEVMQLLDESLIIPGTGNVESLNVSVAAGIFLSEYARQIGIK